MAPTELTETFVETADPSKKETEEETLLPSYGRVPWQQSIIGFCEWLKEVFSDVCVMFSPDTWPEKTAELDHEIGLWDMPPSMVHDDSIHASTAVDILADNTAENQEAFRAASTGETQAPAGTETSGNTPANTGSHPTQPGART